MAETDRIAVVLADDLPALMDAALGAVGGT